MNCKNDPSIRRDIRLIKYDLGIIEKSNYTLMTLQEFLGCMDNNKKWIPCQTSELNTWALGYK